MAAPGVSDFTREEVQRGIAEQNTRAAAYGVGATLAATIAVTIAGNALTVRDAVALWKGLLIVLSFVTLYCAFHMLLTTVVYDTDVESRTVIADSRRLTREERLSYFTDLQRDCYCLNEEILRASLMWLLASVTAAVATIWVAALIMATAPAAP